MSLTTSQIVQIKCPELYSDANYSIWIQLAQEQTDRCYFQDSYNLAVALRACHEWTLNNRPGYTTGASGTISNVKEGDLSIGYQKTGSGSSSGDLESTSYGLQLLDLIKRCGVGISVVGNGNTVIC